MPDDLELMAVYRLGYLPAEQRRPPIDWTSSQRKLPSQYVFRGTCATPQEGWDEVTPAESESLDGRGDQRGGHIEVLSKCGSADADKLTSPASIEIPPARTPLERPGARA